MLMGRVSMAETKQSLVKPGSIVTSAKSSAPCAFRRYGFGIFTTRSGPDVPRVEELPKSTGLGMSFRVACGAPASTQLTIVAISFVRERRIVLELDARMAIDELHGGISRFDTRALMERAHGRTSW